jgi:predicted Zn-dependent protease
MKYKFYPFPHVILVTFAVFTIGCATVDGGGRQFLSTEREIQMGQDAASSIEKEQKVHDSAALQTYIQEIGARVISRSPRTDVPYQFKVIDDDEQVNAFALPGGFMYVYTGLMLMCENEAELASVMAHEISHVADYHHNNAMARRIALMGGVAAVGIATEDAGVAAGAGLAAMMLELKFGRDQERRADMIGMDLLYSGGYKPDAMVTMMQKLNAHNESDGGRPPVLLSSHPPTSARIQNLSAQLSRYPHDQRMKMPVYADRYQKRGINVIKAN